MDLVGYDADVFRAIETEFREFLSHLHAPHTYFLPISALAGDNVVRRSRNMPWFGGPSLLEYLETVPVFNRTRSAPFRFPVQRVMRPDQTFRGYAGQVASGIIRPGDAILALPSGRRSRVRSIETFDGALEEAVAPMAITLTLEDELDISRGDMIASAERIPEVARQFDASVVWLNEQPLDPSRTYVLKHTTQTTRAEIKALQHRLNVTSLEREPADRLEMNAIGVLRIETSRPIYFDVYTENRTTGSFILIDPDSNGTVAAGMIIGAVPAARARTTVISKKQGRVTPAERMARYGHSAATVSLGPRTQLASLLERKLFDRGCAVVISNLADPHTLATDAGWLVLLVSDQEPDWQLPEDDAQAADQIIATLEDAGVLLPAERLTGGEGI
jgi:sulfate adenylyltransferase subunit 1 (EFTu-like GTPase family)